MQMYFFDSEERNPYRNLAFEEILFEDLAEDSVVVAFYTNTSCIVFGKHQNPWRELKVPRILRAGVLPARRISGGGTVFHDSGNLNFSLMTRRDRFERGESLGMVLSAVRSLGIHAEMTEGYDLVVDGRKFSGSSYCFRRNRVLHHGTILLDADLDAMKSMLYGRDDLIETRAIPSRPAHTVNLSDVSLEVDGDAIKQRIVEEVRRSYRLSTPNRLDASWFEAERVEEIEQKNSSWEWIFGKTPRFSVTVRHGKLETRVNVERGIITGIETRYPVLERLHGILEGCRFDREAITMAAEEKRDAVDGVEVEHVVERFLNSPDILAII